MWELLLFLLILIAAAHTVNYLGFTYQFKVKSGPSPVPLNGQRVLYKTGRGAYSEAGFTISRLPSQLAYFHPSAKHLSLIGFYYDDPAVVPSEKLRYALGVILPKKNPELSATLAEAMGQRGYKTTILPFTDNVVYASFPNRGPLALMIAIKRVYPAIKSYIKNHNLCAHPALEVYNSDWIHFMFPLCKQDSFYLCDDDEEDDESEGSGSEESDRCSNSEAEHEDEGIRLRSYKSDRNVSSRRPSDNSSSFEEVSSSEIHSIS